MAIPKVVDQSIIDENFVKWNIPRPDKDYRVVVHCSTYKHESYIEDALKGFVMQKTNFPFCAIVIDDGSPDRTPVIIKQYAASYPDIIKPILLGENHMQHGMSRNPYFEEWHKRTKYIALCEGDDYWTDPHKLQKQVDFLEKNEDYVLVHTDKYVEFGADGVRCTCPHSSEGENVNSLLKANTIATCTTLYRVATYHKISELLSSICRNNHLPMGDYPLWLLLAEYGKIAFLPDFTAVYRVLSESASHTRNVKKAVAFDDGTIRCKIIFYQRYIANNGYSNKLNLEFNEMIFHMRKRMLLDYGWAARGQIIPLLKMLPHWQYICMQSIKRKLNQRK